MEKQPMIARAKIAANYKSKKEVINNDQASAVQYDSITATESKSKSVSNISKFSVVFIDAKTPKQSIEISDKKGSYTIILTNFSSENPLIYQLKGKYLLIHGMADDNVHFQHTTEMANVLINEDKQFDTYFYPNKNHSISGGSSRLHLYRKITDFLMLHLRGGEVKTRIPMNGRIEMMRTIQDSKGKQNIPVKE
jgi:hypothetical protein